MFRDPRPVPALSSHLLAPDMLRSPFASWSPPPQWTPQAYDLWQASQKSRPKVERVKPASRSAMTATRDVRHLKGLAAKPAKPVSVEDMKRAVVRRGSGR